MLDKDSPETPLQEARRLKRDARKQSDAGQQLDPGADDAAIDERIRKSIRDHGA